jgi:hypothetical protein
MYQEQSAAIRFGPAMAVIMICAIVCGAGIGYVWHKKKIEELGKTLSTKQRSFEELLDHRRMLERQFDTATTRTALEQCIAMLGLNLRAPTPDQVLTLNDFESATPERPSSQFASDFSDGQTLAVRAAMNR